MAAHIVTVLNEMIDNPSRTENLKMGLNFAQFGDSLDFDDWLKLNSVCDTRQPEVITEVCKEFLPKYTNIFNLLDNPPTVEEWLYRRWNPEVGRKYKTRLTRAGLR